MKISVIGCGRWGSCIAWYLDSIGHEVTLYGRESSANMRRFLETRTNDYLTLSDTTALTTSLEKALENDTVVISIGTQSLASLCREIAALGTKSKTFVLCMKGIEVGSCRLLTDILSDTVDASNKVAVWLGPGHVQEFTRGIPNCMVIDSADENVKKQLVDEFSSSLIRFYYGNDLLGNQVGAAAKNVIGIAAGVLDGFGLKTMKGALMSRGTNEIARLIKAMGGSELSAYGLCHLGDYEATVFSEHSHNRRFGEAFVRGENYTKLAEGYYTVNALHDLGEKYGVELPICTAVYNMLYKNCDAREEIDALFYRSLKKEFTF